MGAPRLRGARGAAARHVRDRGDAAGGAQRALVRVRVRGRGRGRVRGRVRVRVGIRVRVRVNLVG